MQYSVVITPPSRHPSPITTNVLDEAGIKWVYKPCNSEEDVIAAGTEMQADALMVAHFPLTTRKVMESLPRLKFVGREGVGVDTIDLNAATQLGVCVSNIPGINTSEVADHAMAILLSITRRISELDSSVRSGTWSDNPNAIASIRHKLRRVAGNVVGIYGFGNIGQAFAQRIRGFGPQRIVAHDPYISQTTADIYGVKMVDFDTLLEESDIISVHSASSRQNRELFNKDTFAKMKPTTIFINCARGNLVEESALEVALKNGTILAAGLDVTQVEPLNPESPLLQLNNLIITPHLAGSSNFTAQEGARRWGENVVRFFKGMPLYGLANPDVIKTITLLRAQGNKKWEGTPDLALGRGF